MSGFQDNQQTPQPGFLIETCVLPDPYPGVFANYTHFNVMQSASFEDIFQSDDNVVVSSPTGSGKTVLFELAICRLLHLNPNAGKKIVYMAPTKALCAERLKDWTTKFRVLGLRCGELTGDTRIVDLPIVKESDIIITTPEKWDSISRRWHDSRKLVQMVQLFLIDEVHMLKEKRGATLEVVVSRMKQIGVPIRFIALSATVPNLHDVASWLTRSQRQACYPSRSLSFGEQYRPVQIEKFVYGVPKPEKLNDFAFDTLLTKRVFEIIERHADAKPTIIFCATRRDVLNCAKAVATAYESSNQTAWPMPHILTLQYRDKDLNELTKKGVGFHHAGLDMSDRALVEKHFLNGSISVIVATSTLAVGVNLPAHLVILKNTLQYVGGSFEEYSDIEVLQMLGRAGRPQFDDSGTAVILTEESKVSTYQNLVSGTEVLESSLHSGLLEHLNAEIGLGTFKDIDGAIRWLKSTFLYVRIKQNPRHYQIELDGQVSGIDKTLDSLCRKDVDLLVQNDLVQLSSDQLRITPYGDAMAKYYVRFETMIHILGLGRGASKKDIFIAICKADELKSHRFRNGEKPFYNELKKNPELKFTYSEKTTEIWQKILMLAQLDMCSVDLTVVKEKYKDALNNVSIHKASIRNQLMRLLSCLIDCRLEVDDSVSVRHALELRQSIAAKCWDNHPGVLKQLNGIGDGSLKTLLNAGIDSFNRLERTDPRELERIFKRNPPFGNAILKDLASLPKLSLTVILERANKAQDCITFVFKVRLICENKPRAKKGGQPHFVIFLADSDAGHLLDFRRQSIDKIVEGKEFVLQFQLRSFSKQLRFMLTCEELVGCNVDATHDIGFMEEDFPVRHKNEIVIDAASERSGVAAAEPSLEKRSSNEQAESDTDYLDIFDEEDSIVFAGLGEQVDDLIRSKQTEVVGANTTKSKPAIRPKLLPNGNYACNHACKDKTKCAHACCKEGKTKLTAKEKTVVQDQAVARARQAARDSTNAGAAASQARQRKGLPIDQFNSSAITAPQREQIVPFNNNCPGNDQAPRLGGSTSGIIDLSSVSPLGTSVMSKQTSQCMLMLEELHSSSSMNDKSDVGHHIGVIRSRERSRTLTPSSDVDEGIVRGKTPGCDGLNERNPFGVVSGTGMQDQRSDEFGFDDDMHMFENLSDSFFADQGTFQDKSFEIDGRNDRMLVASGSETRRKRPRSVSVNSCGSLRGSTRCLGREYQPKPKGSTEPPTIEHRWQDDILLKETIPVQVVVDTNKSVSLPEAISGQIDLSFLGDCYVIEDEPDTQKPGMTMREPRDASLQRSSEREPQQSGEHLNAQGFRSGISKVIPRGTDGLSHEARPSIALSPHVPSIRQSRSSEDCSQARLTTADSARPKLSTAVTNSSSLGGKLPGPQSSQATSTGRFSATDNGKPVVNDAFARLFQKSSW